MRVLAGAHAGIAYDLVGSGPRLVLLHGGSGRRRWFDGLVPLLADRFELLLPDLPGHGESAHTPGRYALGDGAAAVAGLLDHLGGRPAVVFGHSHSGHIGLVLAADRPDLVSVLVDGDAPLSRDLLRERLDAARPMNRAWAGLARSCLSAAEISERLRDVEVTDPAGGRTTLGELIGGPEHPYRQEMGACLAVHDPDFLDAVADRFDDTYARLDPTVLLSALRCPLVLLQADPALGGLLSDADVDLAGTLVDRVVVRRLIGLGHGLQFEDPRPVAAAILETVPPLLR